MALEAQESKRVGDMLEDIRSDICDRFCKYQEALNRLDTKDFDESPIYHEHCEGDCPLNRL